MVRTSSEPASLSTHEHRIPRTFLRRACATCCITVLSAVLLLGLWPFQPPGNDVRWLTARPGIRFGHRGIVLSSQSFRAHAQSAPCTIELLLEPAALSGSGTILALDDYPNPKYVFAVRQFNTSVALQRPGFDSQGRLLRLWWRTDHVFRTHEPVVLTIISAQGKATLYIDGAPAGSSSEFGSLSNDLSGRLILGSSAIQDAWHGNILGLAFYSSALSSAEAGDHAHRWLEQHTPLAPGEPQPTALYRFDEGNGTVIHDSGTGDNLLLIRSRYFVLHPAFLEPVWEPFRTRWDGGLTWSYWSDVLVNVAGFVPFGFLFALWFSLTPAISRPRLMALLFGFAISLTIESLQYFLPTRDSSMTDLLTNTIGTAAGVVLVRKQLVRKLDESSSLT